MYETRTFEMGAFEVVETKVSFEFNPELVSHVYLNVTLLDRLALPLATASIFINAEVPTEAPELVDVTVYGDENKDYLYKRMYVAVAQLRDLHDLMKGRMLYRHINTQYDLDAFNYALNVNMFPSYINDERFIVISDSLI